MKIITLSEDELIKLLNDTVTKAMRDNLPEVIRDANKPEWLNPSEVEREYKITRRSQQYLRDTRRLAFRKVGKRVLVHRDEIEKYLNETRINGEN